jgi:hypothetical protein
MRLGLTTLLATALAAALFVAAAGAKPGNGKGNGQGPPAWAGGGAKAGSPPAWAGKAGKDARAERKAERRAALAPAPDDVAEGPKHMNPAWICRFERERSGEEAFAEAYGTNENKANAFGKCVSLEAHDRDGVAPADGEGPDPDGEAAAEAETTEEAELAASARAFFAYLWPYI